MTVTGLVFLLCFFGGLGWALVRNPVFGLYTYVAVFYLNPPSRWWGQFLPDLRWSMLAAAVTIVAALRYRSDVQQASWISNTPAKLLIAYTIWLWIQTPWALDSVQHNEAAWMFTKYLAVSYVVYHLVDTPQKAKSLLLVHLAGCLYLGLLAYGSNVSGRLDGVGGPGIDDSNTLGMQMSTGLVAAAMLMLVDRRWWWAFCGVAAVFAANTLVLTGSRGAFVALVAGGLVLTYLHPKAYHKKFVVYASIAILGFGALASQQFWERMNTLNAVVDKDQELESSAESRIVMAKAQLQMAAKYPFGNGHRGSEVLSAQYLDKKWLSSDGGRSSHNTFLTALVEQGIPGAILYLGFVVWGWRSIRRLRQMSRIAELETLTAYGAVAAAGLTVVLVAGIFEDLLKTEVQIWLAALLCSIFQMSSVAVQRATATGLVTNRRNPLTGNVAGAPRHAARRD